VRRDAAELVEARDEPALPRFFAEEALPRDFAARLEPEPARVPEDFGLLPLERDFLDDDFPLEAVPDVFFDLWGAPDFVEARVDPDRFRLVVELEARCELSPAWVSASSESRSPFESPLLISFRTTPTAAGTATPRAAPATTFCGVDRPSS